MSIPEHAVPTNVPETNVLSFDQTQPNLFEEQRARVHEDYCKAIDKVQSTVEQQLEEAVALANKLMETMAKRSFKIKEELLAHLKAAEVAHKQAQQLSEALKEVEGKL